MRIYVQDKGLEENNEKHTRRMTLWTYEEKGIVELKHAAYKEKERRLRVSLVNYVYTSQTWRAPIIYYKSAGYTKQSSPVLHQSH